MHPKNEGYVNFYECCDLTKKYIYSRYIIYVLKNYKILAVEIILR